MPSPEPISTDRLERLLSGHAPEGEREAQLTGIVRELRAGTPGAPPELRERVRRVAAPPARMGLFWNRGRGWRAAFVLAPAVLCVIGAGAAVYGLAQRDDSVQGVGLRAERFGAQARDQEEAATVPRLAPRRTALPAPLAKDSTANSLSPFTSGRVRDVAATLRLRVPNADRLSDAAGDAMQITRTLGGYVAYVDVDTAGKSGRATLTLRVPVGRVQDAIVRLSDLGTIVGQHVSISDRQVEVDRLARRIGSLRVAIARTQVALANAGSPEERARLQLQLERQRGLLNRLTRQRGGIVREASFARIDMAIVTGKSRSAAAPGPFERAARDALHFLAVAGAAAVFVLIVLSPLLLLAALLALALRSRRRRIEERLLDRLGTARPAPEPAAGQPQ